MNPQHQKLVEYLEAHKAQGSDPAKQRQELIDAGWNASDVDIAMQQIHPHVAPGIGVPTLTPAPTPTLDHASLERKKDKPPVAAQILYALGFLGLIIGLLGAVILFGTSSGVTSIGLGALGFTSTNLKLAAVFIAVTIIAGFTLINFIRAGKKWALISYTTIASLAFASTLYDFVSRSEFEKFAGSNTSGRDLVGYFIIIPLLVILWTKNRDYFK